MNDSTKFVGMDVSKDKIAVAVAGSGREPARYWGEIPNRIEYVRKLIGRLGETEQLQVCYEAGPTGYMLERQLVSMGVACVVVAPSLIPKQSGNRVKTDRRDALRLAELLRAGELTSVWVPGEEDEALRDLVRAREDAKEDLLRADDGGGSRKFPAVQEPAATHGILGRGTERALERG
jgi:transposase